MGSIHIIFIQINATYMLFKLLIKILFITFSTFVFWIYKSLNMTLQLRYSCFQNSSQETGDQRDTNSYILLLNKIFKKIVKNSHDAHMFG